MRQLLRLVFLAILCAIFFSLLGCAGKPLSEQLQEIAQVMNERDWSSCAKMHAYLKAAGYAGGEIDLYFSTHTWSPADCVATHRGLPLQSAEPTQVLVVPAPGGM